MDEDKKRDYNAAFDDPDATPGVFIKAASVQPLSVTDEDMAKINKYTLSELTPEDVFVYRVMMADNEPDDRNYEPFDLAALNDLKELYVGRTMIKDHKRSADSQIGRIYATEVITDESRKTWLDEPHAELVGKVYVPATNDNAGLIAEIKAGIKREVSTSVAPKKVVCSICGKDNMTEWCEHWPGKEYDTVRDGKAVKERCKMILSGAQAAYELSFVAVPAQPRAGTTKGACRGFKKPVPAPTGQKPDKGINSLKTASRILKARIASADSFLNINSCNEK